MDDAPVGAQLAPENVGRFEVGLARVHHHRLLQRLGEPQVAHEQVALHVARRAIVMKVEPALADGHDLRLGTQLLHLREIPLRGVVRMDAGRR